MNQLIILFITGTHQHMEFAPLNFFPTINTLPIISEEENLQIPQGHLSKHESEESQSTFFDEASSTQRQSSTASRKSVTSTYSENHNMVKQLGITIKQMVGKNISDVGCSFTSRQIISETWKVFDRIKSPNKQILKAMFNKEANKKLIEKVGLGSIFNKYGSYEYLNAMEDLRMEVLFRMRSENLKSHLFGRNIQKKERLEAYVQYFVQEELKKGNISSRFSETASQRMEAILKNNQSQAQCIDCYFDNSIEAFVRFAS